MSDPKKMIEDIMSRIERGTIKPETGWDEIRNLQEAYVSEFSQPSWNNFIGTKFQELVLRILKRRLGDLKARDPRYGNLQVFYENEIEKNEVVVRKLSVQFGKYLLLPDADMAVVDYNFADPWNSEVLAIISCKTSLRERIAQACYWKLKLSSSNITKNICVFLTTADHDEDFFLDMRGRERYDGRTRDRVISEYELDGVYILHSGFRKEWESSKVKHYEHIIDDVMKMLG